MSVAAAVATHALLRCSLPRAADNDVSVTEMYHAAQCFRILACPDSAVLAVLPPGTQREMRGTIIEAILATDMSKHMSELQEVQGKEAFDTALLLDRRLLCRAMLHAADVANQVRARAQASAQPLTFAAAGHAVADGQEVCGAGVRRVQAAGTPLTARQPQSPPHGRRYRSATIAWGRRSHKSARWVCPSPRSWTWLGGRVRSPLGRAARRLAAR